MTTHSRPPLAIHFESKTLRQLGVSDAKILITSSHQPTFLPKTGLAKMWAKTPWGVDTPVAMDVDLSCGLYDAQGAFIEAVWYGNLRNQNQSVRHHGDTFIGMNKAYRPSLVDENLSARLVDAPKDAHFLAFFAHSANRQPLAKAVDGMLYLKDGEGKTLHERAFANFEGGVTGFCAWQFAREDDDWRAFAVMRPVSGKDSGDLAKKWRPASV